MRDDAPLFLPLGLTRADSTPTGWPRLAGGWRAVASARRWPGGPVVSAAELPAEWFLPRPAFAGLPMDKPQIMGIVNVTPDSFSDGGDAASTAAAVARGLELAEAGADILDIGGESTRPGAAPVDPEQEAARVVPVIRALAQRGLLISVDTRRAVVMAAALAAGARILNDISALEDPEALPLAVRSGAPVILMHMRGTPQTMQQLNGYEDVVAEVYRRLAQRVADCLAAGVRRENICIDPGIGFAKGTAENISLLAALPLFHGIGVPLLLGASRKRFIAELSADEAPKDRLPGSLVAAQTAWQAGVQIVRVHDVAETRQAQKVWQAAGF